MEELLITGQKKINIAEKEMANLTNMTDEALKNKVYQCFNRISNCCVD